MMDYPQRPFRKSDWILVGLVVGMMFMILVFVGR